MPATRPEMDRGRPAFPAAGSEIGRAHAHLPIARLEHRPYNIEGPLALDPPTRRVLARGHVDDRPAILLVSAESGVLLDAIERPGLLAVDPERRRLHVDVAERGLFTYDLDRLLLRSVVPLPSPDGQAHELIYGPIAVPPVVDPKSGQVFAFRDHDIHVIDPATTRAVRRLGPLPTERMKYIRSATLDPSRGWLYLTAFDSSGEIPAYMSGSRLLGYDLARDEIFLEHGVPGDYGSLLAWSGHLRTTDAVHKRPGFDTHLWREGELVEHIHAWDSAFAMSSPRNPIPTQLAIDEPFGRRYLLLGDRSFVFDLADDSLLYAAARRADPASTSSPRSATRSTASSASSLLSTTDPEAAAPPSRAPPRPIHHHVRTILGSRSDGVPLHKGRERPGAGDACPRTIGPARATEGRERAPPALRNATPPPSSSPAPRHPRPAPPPHAPVLESDPRARPRTRAAAILEPDLVEDPHDDAFARNHR